MAQTYQPQQVIYYNGVPYLSSGSNTQPNPLAPYPAFNGMGGLGLSGMNLGMSSRGLTAQQIQQMIARGQLSPLGNNPFAQKPSYEMKQAPMPTTADLPKPVGQRQDLGSLLNGNQFASAPGGAPVGTGGGMSQGRPQMDFKQFGQNTMSKVLGGGV